MSSGCTASSGSAGTQGSGNSRANADHGSRGDRLVRVELLADRAAVRPGETFTVGVKLTVESGWHIYWENPGDSGLPTKIHLRGPAGFEIGEPRFPTPEREVDEGDIVTYVLKGEVLYLADVRAPREFGGGLAAGAKAVFDVDASWLVCIEACFPGSGRARLEIPIAATGAPISVGSAGSTGSPPASAPAKENANEKLFAAARTRLPRPWRELADVELEWSGSGDRRRLRISVPRASGLELFPLTSETTSLEGRAVANDDRFCRLTADLRFREPSPPELPRLKGVLLVRTAQGELSFQLDSTFDRTLAEPRASK